MVQVTVTATVKVLGGPTLPVSATLDPESYTVAAVDLTAAGGASASQEVPLLPDGGVVVLLAVSARDEDGAPATVSLAPANGTVTGDAFEVDGTLVIANAGVLAALVADGPRTVTLTNDGAKAVTVDLVTGLDPA